MKKYFNKFINLYNSKLVDRLVNDLDNQLLAKLERSISKLNHRNKIIFIGNGGSLAISEHVSNDYSKLIKKRSLTMSDPTVLTCYSNDYGVEKMYAKFIELQYLKNDLVILISSSGNSKNIINAAKYCIKQKIKFYSFTGFYGKNELAKISNDCFVVNSINFNFIENCHQIWLLLICDFIGKTKF